MTKFRRIPDTGSLLSLLGRLNGLVLERLGRAKIAAPDASEPAGDWASAVGLEPLGLSGFAVVRASGDPVRTRPCKRAQHSGTCQFTGAVMTVAATERDARTAATAELALSQRAGAPPRDERQIRRLLIKELMGFDLRRVLNLEEAYFVANQLINGLGDEEAWELAKSPGCESLILPTRPPKLFVFERCLPGLLGGAIAPSVIHPSVTHISST